MKSTLNKILFSITLALPCSAFSVERVQVLPYKYEDVWRGVLIALSKYPLSKNNQSTGRIETKLIKGGEIWAPPYKKVDPNLRYKLIFKLFDGRSGRRYATKVSVVKEAYLKNKFVGDAKSVESDGFEETALIYRANREIVINKLADRKFKSKGN